MSTRTNLLPTVLVLFAAVAALSEGPGDTPAPGETVKNSLGMTFVSIPAGKFVMGLSESAESLDRAFPLYRELSPETLVPRLEELTDVVPHEVRISRRFYMGVHEVTVRQYRRFIEQSGYCTEPERDGTGGYGVEPGTARLSAGRDTRYSWHHAGFPQGDDHPVVNVTWADAVAFCDWLSRKEGKGYRLPSEAEWEYACRAGTTTRYNFGDDPEQLVRNANVYDASCAKVFPEWAQWSIKSDDHFPFTAPVGSFKPNAFGLYDMHGNVWEWCSDWYREDYYLSSPLDDPQGPPTGHLRSRRGGGWHVWPLYGMSCYRNYNTPRSRYLNLGFRVVLEVGP